MTKKRQIRPMLTALAMRAFAYLTGALALTIVAASTGMAVYYGATHWSETLRNLASSTLSGIGIAIGGCVGSALILRFKSARQFVRSVLEDLK